MTGATIQCLSHSANPAIENLELLAGFPPASTCLQGRCLCMSATAANLWSWRGDSNADYGLTRPVLFPLSYTSNQNSGGGGENFTPDDLLCREMPCCLGYTASNLERKAGLEPALSTLATSRLGHQTTSALTKSWSEQRELNSRHRVGGPRHQPLYHARPSHLAGVTGFEPA